MRFRRCKACGHLYTGSLSGETACPKCQAPTEIQIPDGGRFKLEMTGSHALFSTIGSVSKIQELEELRSEIESVQANGAESIALYFQSSTYLSSGMISLLVKTLQMLSQQNKPVYIVTEDAPVIESLHVMNLAHAVRVFPNREAYRAALI